ncbi:LIM/homeobox protein Lhx9 [Papilio xuthus]|uniref:LIM/homeobox protein Lhx9 n=1 Tax=Papilio xuthus TaxID=66420 RepID=A0A194QAW3_PAPXU|nr:LIM/homeobox protein Lhx9 [Papilio xuthus]
MYTHKTSTYQASLELTVLLYQQSERYLPSAYEQGGELSPVATATSPASPRDCTSCRKREPPDEPPAPPPEEACAGCGSRITDRFYLLALERRWHTPCLRCCECKMPLDSEQRCYARDSNIFCKNDYFSHRLETVCRASVGFISASFSSQITLSAPKPGGIQETINVHRKRSLCGHKSNTALASRHLLNCS